MKEGVYFAPGEDLKTQVRGNGLSGLQGTLPKEALVAHMIFTRRYKCPNCKHILLVRDADFIRGIAVVSCRDCGMDAFAIDEEDLRRFLRGGIGAK